MSLCLSDSPAIQTSVAPMRESVLSRVRRLLSFESIEDEGELMPAPTDAEVLRLASAHRRPPGAGEINTLLL